MDTHEPRGSGIVKAVEEAFEAIRRQHAELVRCVVCIASGGRGDARVHGHYASMRWASKADAHDEILIAGERLADGAEEVFHTLLHEAAHQLATVRGISDTSRGGRYHNDRFADVAAEVGLDCTKGTHGWAETTLTMEAAAKYAKAIAKLAAGLTAYRQPEADRDRATRQQSGRLECPCGRIIRASAKTIEEGPIVCGVCESPFYIEVTTDGHPIVTRTIGDAEVVPWLTDPGSQRTYGGREE